jgi:hypothetical protein
LIGAEYAAGKWSWKMKIIIKSFAAVGFGLCALIVAQVAMGMIAGQHGISLVAVVLGFLGAAVGWHRVK